MEVHKCTSICIVDGLLFLKNTHVYCGLIHIERRGQPLTTSFGGITIYLHISILGFVMNVILDFPNNNILARLVGFKDSVITLI